MRPRTVVRILVTVICGVILISTSVAAHGDPLGGNGSNPNAAWWAGAILFFYWAFALGNWAYNKVEPTLDAAITPVPSPNEIYHQLLSEGYQPSVQDVAAIHQMLTAERNNAAANLGLGLGALYLANRAL